MSSAKNEIQVIHNRRNNRFEVSFDNKKAVLIYMLVDDRIVYQHTHVPPEFSGKGIGGMMAKAALEYAKQEGYRVSVLCPFVAAYIKKHPEYLALMGNG